MKGVQSEVQLYCTDSFSPKSLHTTWLAGMDRLMLGLVLIAS
jgi:hypothetical protein